MISFWISVDKRGQYILKFEKSDSDFKSYLSIIYFLYQLLTE